MPRDEPLARAASSLPALLEARGSSSDGDDSGDERRVGGRELRAARSAAAFERLPSLGQERRRRPRGLLLALDAESDPCLLADGDSLDSLDELRGDDEQDARIDALRVVVVRAQSPPSAQSSSSSSSTSSVLERLSTADRESLALMRSERVRVVAAHGATKGAEQHRRPPIAPGDARRKIHRSRSAIRAWLSATFTKRTLRKLSAVRNSYFACWLVVCSLAVVALQIIAITIVHFLYEPPIRESSSSSSSSSSSGSSSESEYTSLHTFYMSPHRDPSREACGGRLLLLMHLVGIPNVMLLAPVVFPASTIFQLYVVRDRRMVRRPYLLLCELIVAAQLAFMTYFAVRQVLNVPTIVECHARAKSHEILMFYSSIVVWIVLLRQIIVFARFLTHIKLQADGADDSSHTSAMGSSKAVWKRLLPEFLISARRKRKNEIAVFKKQLYRAAARGDVTQVAELLSKTRQQSDVDSGESASADPDNTFRMTEQELQREYTTPRLWFGAFARSRKNPLHIAVIRGHLPVVRMLLDHGFDPNALDKVSRVNFNLALIFKLCSRLLILTQDRRRSPLRALVCSVLLPPLHGAVAAGYVHIVRELIDRGADVNAIPRASFYYRQAELPPIFVTDDPQVLQLLVSNGANFLYVAAVGLSGATPRKRRMLATPLQQSAFTLRSDLSEYLIECGADVALTPLHAAAARDDTKKIAKLLASRHATQIDTRGERVAAGVFRRTPLHWAAIAGSFKAARMLLEHGADPNARDRDGRTPLHWAARNNRPEIVSLLINRGADPQAVDTTINKLPVVCFAAEAEGVSVNVFASLARAGASLHTQVGALGGDTALHIALQHENRQTALSLIKCGANMMTTNSVGKRAVDCTTSTELQFYLKKEAGSRKIMISYTHSHFQLAQRVREYLETREQLTCWLDTMDPSGIGGGAVWREEIARGISNCSLVLSLVSEGYTRSEWCLKELALAKLLRKPVLALIIEEGAKPLLPALESLIPKENQVSFYDFITGSHVQENPRAIIFDIDDSLFASRWQVMRPLLVSVMKDGRRIEQDDEEAVIYTGVKTGAPNKAGLAMHGGHGRRKMTVVQETNESEDDDRDDENNRNILNSRIERKHRRSSTGTMASVTLAARLVVARRFRRQREDAAEEEKRERPRVLLYSPAGEQSVLLQKIRADLDRLGFVCQPLDLSTNEDNDVIRQLLGAESVVFLIESHLNSDDSGSAVVEHDESVRTNPTKCARKQVSEALSRVLVAAAAVNGDYSDEKSAKNPPESPKVRVLPVVVQRNFLDLSKMYSLARSQLYYFMDDGGGAQWRRSASELLGRLQREHDSHRLRIG